MSAEELGARLVAGVEVVGLSEVRRRGLDVTLGGGFGYPHLTHLKSTVYPKT
jgi:hypothetical protein